MTVDRFVARLSGACAVLPGSRVLAAVSGGADSVALLRLLCEAAERMGLEVRAAHVEHGVRGEASREDEAFVRALCAELGVPLCVGHVDAPAYARARGCGLEDAARALRYAFLERAARETDADAVALAHHRRDQAETVLLRAARGSDVRGLCAMRWRRGVYVRPLLGETPEALRDYLTRIGQRWREDETNGDVRYARNRVRRRVLPELDLACPGAEAALARLASAAQRDEDYFDARLRALALPQICLVDGLAMERGPLQTLHPALLSRLLVRRIEDCGLPAQDAGTVEAVVEAIASGGEACVNLTRGAHAHVGARFVCLTRGEAPPPEEPLPAGGETRYGCFEVRAALPGETGDGRYAQAMPLRLLEGMTVGSRREGERMALFGGGHAPLAKLMAEAGVERAMRASVPILRDARGEAVWAVGLRAGALCRVTPGEEAALVRYRARQTEE